MTFSLYFSDTHMEPILVHPCVYVLSLEDDCWYVGITFNLNVRLGQHWTGCGAKWTRIHKPVSVVEVIYPATRAMENQVTLRYIELHGKDKVKGGSWCRVADAPSDS